MSLINPTSGNESQFNPKFPTDNSLTSFKGNTFNLTDPNEDKLKNGTITNPANAITKFSDGNTFDLTNEQLKDKNPGKNIVLPTKPTDDGEKSFAGNTFDLTKEDLTNKNPANNITKYSDGNTFNLTDPNETKLANGQITNPGSKITIPTQPTDDGEKSFGGNTFNLTDPNEDKLKKGTITNPSKDITKYIDGNTFDLTKEDLKDKNPSKKITKPTKPTDDGKNSFSGNTFDLTDPNEDKLKKGTITNPGKYITKYSDGNTFDLTDPNETRLELGKKGEKGGITNPGKDITIPVGTIYPDNTFNLTDPNEDKLKDGTITNPGKDITKPTKPTDDGEKSFSGNTFNLTDPNEDKLKKGTITNPAKDITKYSDGNTFDLTKEDLKDKNPVSKITKPTQPTEADNPNTFSGNTFNLTDPNETGLELGKKGAKGGIISPSSKITIPTSPIDDSEFGDKTVTFNLTDPNEDKLKDGLIIKPASKISLPTLPIDNSDYGDKTVTFNLTDPNEDKLARANGAGNKEKEAIRNASNFTNITGQTITIKSIAFGAIALASAVGLPTVAQIATAVANKYQTTSAYSTLSLRHLGSDGLFAGILYPDFRSKRALSGGPALINTRLDGLSTVLRDAFNTEPTFNVKATAYAATSALIIGAYSLFNLDGTGTWGYGWGDHGNIYAFRNDFTMGSSVRSKWKDDKWERTRFPESVLPFRGDKVTVIDAGTRSSKQIYQWFRPPKYLGPEKVRNFLSSTQDFIKFYLTGPKIKNTTADAAEVSDQIMVFRATISSLSDSFSPQWSSQQIIGRADPNYYYTGFSRELSLDFTVMATDRDEVKPIWRKLNALAGYTAPIYDPRSIAMTGPWLRLTIGDLFVRQPAIITSLSYTLHDSDTTWEINIEDEAAMMQVPHKISVSMQFNLITDYLPQNEGKFYTLAKRFDAESKPIAGNDNWLSDFNGADPSKTITTK